MSKPTKRGYERKIAKDASEQHPGTAWIKWMGDRNDLGLEKGKEYTYKMLGAAVGIAASSMRGRLKGSKEALDSHMWANGERKPKELWGVTTFERCETKVDKISQKYLRMAL